MVFPEHPGSSLMLAATMKKVISVGPPIAWDLPRAVPALPIQRVWRPRILASINAVY
jgi:hypothetical protein